MISLLLACFTYICSYSSLFTVSKYIYLEIKLKVIQELNYLKYLCIIITEIGISILFTKSKVSSLLLSPKDMGITRTCYLKIMI